MLWNSGLVVDHGEPLFRIKQCGLLFCIWSVLSLCLGVHLRNYVTQYLRGLQYYQFSRIETLKISYLYAFDVQEGFAWTYLSLSVCTVMSQNLLLRYYTEYCHKLFCALDLLVVVLIEGRCMAASNHMQRIKTLVKFINPLMLELNSLTLWRRSGLTVIISPFKWQNFQD